MASRVVSIKEFVKATAHMEDDDVVRWFANGEGTVGFTFGELRLLLRKGGKRE